MLKIFKLNVFSLLCMFKTGAASAASLYNSYILKLKLYCWEFRNKEVEVVYLNNYTSRPNNKQKTLHWLLGIFIAVITWKKNSIIPCIIKLINCILILIGKLILIGIKFFIKEWYILIMIFIFFFNKFNNNRPPEKRLCLGEGVKKYISWHVFIKNSVILFISGLTYHYLSFFSSYFIIFIFIGGMALLLLFYIKGGVLVVWFKDNVYKYYHVDGAVATLKKNKLIILFFIIDKFFIWLSITCTRWVLIQSFQDLSFYLGNNIINFDWLIMILSTTLLSVLFPFFFTNFGTTNVISNFNWYFFIILYLFDKKSLSSNFTTVNYMSPAFLMPKMNEDQANFIIEWLSSKAKIYKEELKNSFDLSNTNLLAISELIRLHKVHNNRYAIYMPKGIKTIKFVEEEYLRHYTPYNINKPVPIFEHVGKYLESDLKKHMSNLDNNSKFVFIWSSTSGDLYQVVTGLNYVETNTILFHGFQGNRILNNKAIPYNPQFYHRGCLDLYIKDLQGEFHLLNHKSDPRPFTMKNNFNNKLIGKNFILIKEVNENVRCVYLVPNKPENFPINTVHLDQRDRNLLTRFKDKQ